MTTPVPATRAHRFMRDVFPTTKRTVRLASDLIRSLVLTPNPAPPVRKWYLHRGNPRLRDGQPWTCQSACSRNTLRGPPTRHGDMKAPVKAQTAGHANTEKFVGTTLVQRDIRRTRSAGRGAPHGAAGRCFCLRESFMSSRRHHCQMRSQHNANTVTYLERSQKCVHLANGTHLPHSGSMRREPAAGALPTL